MAPRCKKTASAQGPMAKAGSTTSHITKIIGNVLQNQAPAEDEKRKPHGAVRQPAQKRWPLKTHTKRKDHQPSRAHAKRHNLTYSQKLGIYATKPRPWQAVAEKKTTSNGAAPRTCTWMPIMAGY